MEKQQMLDAGYHHQPVQPLSQKGFLAAHYCCWAEHRNGAYAPNGYDGNQQVALFAWAYHLMAQPGGSNDHGMQDDPLFSQGHGSLTMMSVVEEDASMPHTGKDELSLVQQIQLLAP